MTNHKDALADIAGLIKILCMKDEAGVMLALANRIVGNAHPAEDARLEVAYEIARYLKLDWPAALASPAPSAPVVDDAIKAAAMRCARRAYGFWRGGSNGSWEALEYFDGGYVGRERDAAMYEGEIRAALSGVSAPVGVEGESTRECIVADRHYIAGMQRGYELGCNGDHAALNLEIEKRSREIRAALTTPASEQREVVSAATRVEEVEQKDCPKCTQATYQRDAIYRECLCGRYAATGGYTPSEDNATPAAAGEPEALSLLRELRESNALSPYWQGRADPVLERATQPEAREQGIPSDSSQRMTVPYGSASGDKDYAYGYEKGFADGWNRHLAAAPEPVRVSEEMVERACEAFYTDESWRMNTNHSRDFMRAALTAALAGKERA